MNAEWARNSVVISYTLASRVHFVHIVVVFLICILHTGKGGDPTRRHRTPCRPCFGRRRSTAGRVETKPLAGSGRRSGRRKLAKGVEMRGVRDKKFVQPIIKACELCIELYCKAAKPEAKDEDYINATDEQLMWWSTYGSPEQKAKVTATASLRASRSAVKVT